MEQRIGEAVRDAIETLLPGTPGPSLLAAAERAAGAVLEGERRAGRIREFRVRCEAEDDAGTQGISVEIAYVPPKARARTVVVRLSVRGS